MNEFDLRLQNALAKRKAGQDALQSFQTPQGQMVGGVYIKPSISDSLIQGLRMYSGKKDAESADQEIKDVMQQRTESTNKALAEFLRNSKGTPANVPQDGVGPVMPAQAPNMEAAYGALMQSPDLRQMGQQGMMQLPQVEAQKQEREDARAFRQQEAQAARAASVQQLELAHQQRMAVLASQNASREQIAQAQREFMLEMKKMGGASQQPYFQPVQTAQGVFAFNARTGKVELVTGANGAPIIGAQADPSLQGAIAGAKSGATTEAKARTEARLEAPQVVAQADEAVKLVDDLLKAPGLKQAVGASRMVGIQRIPGTDAKDFDIRLDQLKGKQFLQAFESLKGGGAITEIEGKKATDAIARMDAAGSEAEFTKAAREFQSVIRQGAERARAKGGAPAAPASPATPKPRMKFDAQGNPIP
jgi:hypothetical protein